MYAFISFLALLASSWVSEPEPTPFPKREFRATWVASAYNIDWPSAKGLSTEEQQAEFLQMLDQQQALGMNAIVVQVRAAGDAFYPSRLVPWSEFLTGTQGQAPDPYYDPLAFMIEACHERNLEFHAWFNPFRGISHVRFSSVAQHNPLLRNAEWTFLYGETRFLDPGNPAVQDHLTEVICEVLRGYDLDGVHFDDYFYPYRKNGQPIPDGASFARYGQGYTQRDAWRRSNVDRFIERIADSIQAIRPYVKFGVSPVGIWRNKDQDPLGSNSRVDQTAYDVLHADVRKWLQLGWIDYVAPQLYWSTEHPRANYAELLPWWADNSFGRHLYVGQALFKLKKDQNRYWHNPRQLPAQLDLNRRYPQVKGSIFYSANAFRDNPHQVLQMLRRQRYRYPALVPGMQWKDSIPPLAPRELRILPHPEGAQLLWQGPESAADEERATYYVIYRYDRGAAISTHDPANIVGIQRDSTWV
ncbi:MAG: family 10 glycosylhydrolase, partial [Bacteroidota bacterium]